MVTVFFVLVSHVNPDERTNAACVKWNCSQQNVCALKSSSKFLLVRFLSPHMWVVYTLAAQVAMKAVNMHIYVYKTL